MEQSGSKAWQLATLIVPVILTGWLTFIFSRSQARLQQEFEAQNQKLSAQLSLATELFKKRFDAYETLYIELTSLKEKLLLQEANIAANLSKSKNVKTLAATKRQTADLLAQLDKLNQENALHVSDDVSNLMSDAWKAGVDGNSDLLSQKISEVEVQMKKEIKAEMEKNVVQAKADAAAVQ
ncbi:MAG TPA: hypothetical protein VED66_11530 [Candidatus Sulfotelmatobacter sp.]|nr:hypothetical protein [Candidatus Sulfotelmatobacter sp.]